MARPKKEIVEGEVAVDAPFERTLYEKNGIKKPAKWKAIADKLESDGWTKVE